MKYRQRPPDDERKLGIYMIEPDRWIAEHADVLGVNPKYINPASVDVCLGQHIIRKKAVQDPEGVWSIQTDQFVLDEGEAFIFEPGYHYLCHTEEFTCCPTTHAWQLILKSSSGRKGLDHAHSGWGDPGFKGQITFEFVAHLPVTFKRGDRIAQLIYMLINGQVEFSYDPDW
jgi:deoxycytidine triphosphate deaminase